MSKGLKYYIISYYLLFFYIYFYMVGFTFSKSYSLPFDGTILVSFYISNFILILFILKKRYVLNISMFIKILFFTIFLKIYFFIESLVIQLYMYSIGGSGGYIRNNIYDDIDHIFTVSEVLYWNFIFSLHYPIYIFIFIKPFVNHLDKSIKKIRKSKEAV